MSQFLPSKTISGVDRPTGNAHSNSSGAAEVLEALRFPSAEAIYRNAVPVAALVILESMILLLVEALACGRPGLPLWAPALCS